MKALLVVAFKDYQDKEYSDTRKKLEDDDIEIEVVSSKKGTAQGAFGSSIEIDKVLEEIDVDNYDAIVFIGGGGAVSYFEDRNALDLARQAYEADKVVAAICCAPIILNRADILSDKKITVYPNSDWISELSKKNEYLDQKVVVDNNIITASGPEAASEFGKTIAEKLKS